MTKQEFIVGLRRGLSGLPKQEIEEQVSFYSEMIDDRMEEGLSERSAVAAVGSADRIAAQIRAENPFALHTEKGARTKRRLRAWEIVLLALGSPIWLSLAVAAFAVILSLYAVLWSLIVALWAVFVSLVACAVGGVAASVIFIVGGKALAGIAVIGAGAFCAGLAILLFFGCRAATGGTVLLSKKILSGIKKCFVGKERAS